MSRCIFGIDVSSRKCNVCVTIDNIVDHEYVIYNNFPGFTDLLKDLVNYPNSEIIFEATGVYTCRLERFLTDYEYDYSMVNPLLAKKEMSEFRMKKDDRHDARMLAKIQYFNKHRITKLKKDGYDKLNELSRYYDQLTNDYVRTKNRLHRSLQYTFPEIEDLMSHPSGPNYFNIIKQYPHAQLVLQASTEELTGFINGLSFRGHGNVSNIVNRLRSLASLSYPAVNIDSYILEQIQDLADELLRLYYKRRELVHKMDEVAQKMPNNDAEILQSIPGFGKESALRFLGEVGDLRRFPDASKINAYIGIDLRKYESGKFISDRHISKQGNAIARKIMYNVVNQAMSASSQYNIPSHIADFYERKKQSLPKNVHSYKKIAIAAIHRILRTAYLLILTNQTYDYQIAIAHSHR